MASEPIYQRRFSYAAVRKVAEDFEMLLQGEGIDIASGSALERMTLSVYDAIYRHKLRIRASQETDIRKIAADVGALSELAYQVLQVRDHPDFSQLKEHLKLLNRAEVSQNRPHSVLDDASNKVFELLAACLTMRTRARVQLEDPNSSAGGRNPDVIVDYGSMRWGIACKVVHSRNPQTIIDNINTGIRQIEAAPVDTGFVFVNLKNIVNHEQYWPVTNTSDWENGADPIFWAYQNWEVPVRMLHEELSSWGTSLVTHVGSVEPIRELFRGKKTIPAVLFYAHVISGFVLDQHPAPMALKLPMLLQVEKLGDETIERFQQLHEAAMDIPGSEPADPIAPS